jgi:hypothetical protein
VIVLAIVVVAFSLSTGWSLFCSPALPTVLFSSMGPEFILNVVAPECPILGSGLIANAEYVSFFFHTFARARRTRLAIAVRTAAINEPAPTSCTA